MDINKLRRGLEIFSNISPELNVTTILIFLFVAQRGTCTQKDVEVALNLTNATASRGVSYWTDFKKYDVEGVGFIDRIVNPRDKRYRLLTLTKAGKQFYEKIKSEV